MHDQDKAGVLVRRLGGPATSSRCQVGNRRTRLLEETLNAADREAVGAHV